MQLRNATLLQLVGQNKTQLPPKLKLIDVEDVYALFRSPSLSPLRIFYV